MKTPTKTKKVKLGLGCKEGENVNEDDEGAKLGQGLAKAASMAKTAQRKLRTYIF